MLQRLTVPVLIIIMISGTCFNVREREACRCVGPEGRIMLRNSLLEGEREGKCYRDLLSLF